MIYIPEKAKHLAQLIHRYTPDIELNICSLNKLIDLDSF